MLFASFASFRDKKVCTCACAMNQLCHPLYNKITLLYALQLNSIHRTEHLFYASTFCITHHTTCDQNGNSIYTSWNLYVNELSNHEHDDFDFVQQKF